VGEVSEKNEERRTKREKGLDKFWNVYELSVFSFFIFRSSFIFPHHALTLTANRSIPDKSV